MADPEPKNFNFTAPKYDMSLETWEMLSYVVTVIGLPMAILIFIYEQRKERENEEEVSATFR